MRWKAGPAGRAVWGRMGFRGRKQPFGAEPGGGVRNREKGASCLSAASSCPAGSAARRPGSSQRQGCPFFWFFSLGRQRKERHPARGRCHLSDAGASGHRSHAVAWEQSTGQGCCPGAIVLCWVGFVSRTWPAPTDEHTVGGGAGHAREPLTQQLNSSTPHPRSLSSRAISLAKYVRIISAPARRMAIRLSAMTRSPSIQPRSAAALIMAYSPLTW